MGNPEPLQQLEHGTLRPGRHPEERVADESTLLLP